MIGEAQLAEQGQRMRAHLRVRHRAKRPHRQHDIVQRSKFRQQKWNWKIKPREDRRIFARASSSRPAVDWPSISTSPLVGIEQAQQIEQRGFSRTGRTRDRDQPAGNAERNIAHQRTGISPGSVRVTWRVSMIGGADFSCITSPRE